MNDTVKEAVLAKWTGPGLFLSSDLSAATDKLPLAFAQAGGEAIIESMHLDENDAKIVRACTGP